MIAFSQRLHPLSEAVADALGKSHKLSRSALGGAFMAAGLRSSQNGLLSGSSLTQTFRMARRGRLFMEMLRTINDIDDVVDNMTPEARLALGEAKLGNTPCDFLKGNEIALDRYFNTVQENERGGIMSVAENISFGNIYAVLLKEGAEAEIEYNATRDVAARERLTESNLQVAQVLGSHILHHFLPDDGIRAKSKAGTLGVEDAIDAYPHASRVGRLIEMCDDLEDVFTDLEREAETGIVSPNWFATDMERRQRLYGPDNRMAREMTSFLARYHDSIDAIPFNAAPLMVREAVIKGEQEFGERLQFMPRFERKTLQLVWDGILRNGLKSAQHPDVLKGSVLQPGYERHIG